VKGAKLEDFEGMKVTSFGQVKAKTVTTTDEVIKEQVRVLGQQMSEKCCTQTLVCILL
jgi:hypothetical protein